GRGPVPGPHGGAAARLAVHRAWADRAARGALRGLAAGLAGAVRGAASGPGGRGPALSRSSTPRAFSLLLLRPCPCLQVARDRGHAAPMEVLYEIALPHPLGNELWRLRR